METLSAKTETGVMDQVEDGDEETEGMPRDEDPLAVVIQYRGDSESRSVSPAPTICSTTSQSEDEENVRRKRPKQSTKTLIDNKREKLQKKLTQEGKQDILIQHSQKQLEFQQAIIEGLTKKDDGLEAALKSMAE